VCGNVVRRLPGRGGRCGPRTTSCWGGACTRRRVGGGGSDGGGVVGRVGGGRRRWHLHWAKDCDVAVDPPASVRVYCAWCASRMHEGVGGGHPAGFPAVGGGGASASSSSQQQEAAPGRPLPDSQGLGLARVLGHHLDGRPSCPALCWAVSKHE